MRDSVLNEVPSEIPLPLLQLEYIRRYQLDEQINFYQYARRRHTKSAYNIVMLSGIAVFLGTIATGLSAILGSFVHGLAGFAALGVIGMALSTYAATLEGIGQNRQTAERYGQICDSLVEIRFSEELDSVRRAAAEGNRGPVEMFVSAVHEQLSTEHKQWLKAAERKKESIANLRESLEKHKSV